MYFEKENSIAFQTENSADVAEVIFSRYKGQNTHDPYVYRGSLGKIFTRAKDFKYHLEFNSKFPDAKNEEIVYVKSSLWSHKEDTIKLEIEVNSPTMVYINGERVFKSINKEEVKIIPKTTFNINLNKGWNDVLLSIKKTNSGFGARFGTALIKNMPLHFVIQEEGYQNKEGFIYSKPVDKETEVTQVTTWYPEAKWSKEEKALGVFERLYGKQKENIFGFAQTKVIFNSNNRTIKGSSLGPIKLYVDDKVIYKQEEKGSFEVTLETRETILLIQAYASKDGWGFELNQTEEVKYQTPFKIHGSQTNLIYLGPFKTYENQINDLYDQTQIFKTLNETSYWRLDEKETYVRPFDESKSYFGVWNYPLGVTLYGFLKASKVFLKNELYSYVKKHIKQNVDYFNYAVWDRKTFGAPGMNYQISGVDSLDDCGSFASTMLELNKDLNDLRIKEVADHVADYITNKQARLEDGALYRNNEWNVTMDNTMWADDLYMSTPFLTRYYQLTKDQKYLDDAANQFLLFKKYLWVESKQLMSHVINFNVGKPTEVFWGRGNGWVLFSLSEILEVMPKTHRLYNQLLEFFLTLSKSYLNLQNPETGMWHQVLDDHESYAESSATSMFVYGFSRGVRLGWYKDSEPYLKAAKKGGEALLKHAVDKYGNVYGICKGSGYSYSPNYYKDELPWLLNDPHGTGIILLALSELELV